MQGGSSMVDLDTDRGHPLAGRGPAIDIPTVLRAAAPNTGAIFRIMARTGLLSLGPGRLAPAEFLAHRLWDADYGKGDLRRFAGLHGQARFHGACCDIGWKAVSDDKLIVDSVLVTGGMTAVPEMIGLVHPTRSRGGVVAVRSMSDLVGFLREPDHYPLVAKPIDGVFSVGVIHAHAIDPRADTLISIAGRKLPLPAVTSRILGDSSGYLIQRALQPPDTLAVMSGGRLCTVRMLVLLRPDGPLIHRAALKIPVGINMADNYWRAGNRLGAVALGSGQIIRVVAGTAQHLRRDPCHPDTGKPIEGITIPDWSELCDLVVRAALLFPGIRTQSWDVAITDGGPILLEINWGGDLHLHQIAHGEGVLDPVFCDHLRCCGYRGKLPA